MPQIFIDPTTLRFPAARALAASALLVALLLAGCVSELERVKAGTIYPPTAALMEKKGMDRTAPILVRVFKESRELEVWKRDRTGNFALLKSYPICRYSGTLGPKRAEGDYQAPEGFYDIRLGQMNPKSVEYLSFNVGYPNAYDKALGRTGDSLMVHGGCRSVGCYAMTDEHIEEIYALAYEAFRGGQTSIQFQAFPFRMTAANLEQHKTDANAPFWQDLKSGNDLFEATAQPPEAAVCNQQYVFNPAGVPVAGGSCSTVSL